MPSFLVLNAAKKRRRKQPPGAPTMPESEEDIDNLTEKDLADIADVSRFEFKPDTFIANNDSGGFGLPGSDPFQLDCRYLLRIQAWLEHQEVVFFVASLLHLTPRN